MKQRPFSRRALGLGVLLAALGAAPAQAKPPWAVDTSMCAAPQLSQPFLSIGDSNWYTLVPGESPDNFDGAGWTLSGGARIITTTLPDGKTGSVLDLPTGAQAVSPTVCVQSNYPTARSMVLNGASSKGVSFSVAYAGTKTWGNPHATGRLYGRALGWSPSDPVQVNPNKPAGWQPVQFTFTADKTPGDTQIYNFYVDPRMSG